MDFENAKRKFGIKSAFKHLWRRAAVERDAYHLSQEQKRLRTEIELAECEAEVQSRAAGLAAFELWEGGAWEKAEQELTVYFSKIREKNEEIIKRNLEIGKLEEQIWTVRCRHAEEDGNEAAAAGDEAAAAAVKINTVCVCPVCGASFHRPAHFCRRCGSMMMQAAGKPEALNTSKASQSTEPLEKNDTEGES